MGKKKNKNRQKIPIPIQLPPRQQTNQTPQPQPQPQWQQVQSSNRKNAWTSHDPSRPVGYDGPSRTEGGQPQRPSECFKHIPPWRGQLTQAETESINCRGIVTTLKETFGFIKISKEDYARLHVQHDDIFFSRQVVKNLNAGPVSLARGTQVLASFNPQRARDGKPPPANLVVIEAGQGVTETDTSGSQQRPPMPQNTPNARAELRIGTICIVRDRDFVFLKNREEPRDVFMFKDKVSKYALPLSNGDQVKYMAKYEERGPSVIRASVVEYISRSEEELSQYLNVLRYQLKSKQSHEVVSEIVSLGSLWHHLANKGPIQDQEYVCCLLKTVNLVLKECKTQVRPAAALLDCLLNSDALLKSDWVNTDSVEKKTIKTTIKLLNTVLAVLPQRSLKTYNVLQKFTVSFLKDKETLSRADQTAVLEPQQQLLQTAITELSKHTLSVGGLDQVLDDTSQWRTLHTIITQQELLGGQNISKDKHLQAVALTQGYESSEEYLSTYFRLFRAETFSAIQVGVNDFLAGKLDTRDMAVFTGVSLVGIETTYHSLSLALSFQPPNKNIDWSCTKLLMRGNLLCLSPSGRFDDVVWATVTTRDEDLLYEGIMFAELSDINVKSKKEILASLQASSGAGIMVESPTFYKPMGAVLNGFKKIDMEVFPLCKEIISASFTNKSPAYVARNCTEIKDVMKEMDCDIVDDKLEQDVFMEDVDIVGEDLDDTELIEQSLAPNFNISSLSPDQLLRLEAHSEAQEKLFRNMERKAQKGFDSQPYHNDNQDETCRLVKEYRKQFNFAQEDAFLHALTQRLAIIQGPPGTGKTFIGIKIVDILLRCLGPEEPILVVTYKNHALDEFIKGIIYSGACSKSDLVRIGSRSKDPSLEECNLRSWSRSERSSRPIWEQIMELKTRIQNLSEEVQQSMWVFLERVHMTKQRLLWSLSNEQLISLLCGTQWNEGERRVYYKISKNINADIYWVYNTLLPELANSFPEGLHTFVRKGVPDHKTPKHQAELWTHGRNMLLKALTLWIPDRSNLLQLRRLHGQHVNDASAARLEQDNMNWNNAGLQGSDETKEGAPDDITVADQEHIKEVLEARALALGQSTQLQEKGSYRRFMLPISVVRGDDSVISLLDFPSNLPVNRTLLAEQNMWRMDENDKFRFLYTHLAQTREQGSAECVRNAFPTKCQECRELEDSIEQLEAAFKQKQSLELNRDIKVLQSKKIIAMTINGASINRELMQAVKPSVVIVEEAAEIIETSMMAALNDNVKHLVLIGDHKQLRPQVDTYNLSRDYNFDVSMMERLIGTGYPFQQLTEQHRMRPEFAELLKDIYPKLETNPAIARKNEPLAFMKKSMFFWSHNHLEGASGKNKAAGESRSKRNEKEAEMVAALAMFFLSMGINSNQITILSAYLGQTVVIREILSKLYLKHRNIFGGNTVRVCTIDQYQGDENDYIIVSLVRSNMQGIIGFLDTLNRRCVAQSRAKKGMYIIGNTSTLSAEQKGGRVSHWVNLINGMKKQGCVGECLTVQCPSHQSEAETSISNALELQTLAEDVSQLCKHTCIERFKGCDDKTHTCKKPCYPRHTHYKCLKKVTATKESCGHSIDKQCWEKLSNIACQHKVQFIFSKCGHPGQRKCYNTKEPACPHLCQEEMPNCPENHTCTRTCGERHDHVNCMKTVQFTFDKCGHMADKICSEKMQLQICNQTVHVLLSCGPGHIGHKLCSEKDNQIRCQFPCIHSMSCKEKHACPSPCGDTHNHNNCMEPVSFQFPGCGHKGNGMKPCSEPFSLRKCTEIVRSMAPCGHNVDKTCYQNINDARCKALCTKTRNCGHKCFQECSKPCDAVGISCKICTNQDKARMKAFRQAGERNALQIEREAEAMKTPQLSLIALNQDEPEFFNVKDLVTKFIKPMHNWFPNVTMVQKVDNIQLRINFEKAKKDRFGDHIALKFHGTSDVGVQGITKNGFKKPAKNPIKGKRPGMFGQGIYFATDSSKSAQSMYTEGSNQLLLCEVQLGKAKKMMKSNHNITHDSLSKEGFDSVFAPRGSSVKNDEFVVFDADQAYPKYIIHFTATNVMPPDISPVQDGGVQRKRVLPSRSFDLKDSDDYWYRVAESFLLRSTKKLVESIDIISNPVLQAAFDSQKAEFQSKGISGEEVLAFHGTNPSNVDSIIMNNLNPDIQSVNGRVYGNGAYLSEQAKVSLPYGGKNGLMLFRVLPGKEFLDSDPKDYPDGFHCRKVKSDSDGNGWALVIRNSKQFVPVAVYNLN